jgi:ABC-type polysaccharide/polyol phosphate export permease
MAFVCGLALGSSAVNVFIRDTRYLVDSFNLVLFWLVPIFYSFAIIPQKYAEIYKFNPVAALVMAMRNILIEGIPPPMSLVRNLALAASVSIAIGFGIFERLKNRFYEHI